jgi:hypothetical protein
MARGMRLVETPACAAFERCAQFAGATVLRNAGKEDGWLRDPERLDHQLRTRASWSHSPIRTIVRRLD